MLTENEKKIFAAYEKRLQTPKWKFIIQNGLIWSALVFVIMLLQKYFARGESLKQQWNEGLAINLVFLLVAGLVYGWLIRLMIQRKYDQLKAKNN